MFVANLRSDLDIKRRKKLDAQQRHEAMKILYDAKKLSLFSAKHFPKVLFTLLKLGADPFEIKQSKKGYNRTLTYAIIKSKTLLREKRLNLLHHLEKKQLLRADPCGPNNISHISICLKDQTKTHALPYLVGAGGIDSCKSY